MVAAFELELNLAPRAAEREARWLAQLVKEIIEGAIAERSAGAAGRFMLAAWNSTWLEQRVARNRQFNLDALARAAGKREVGVEAEGDWDVAVAGWDNCRRDGE